jgi:hypothetical protein
MFVRSRNDYLCVCVMAGMYYCHFSLLYSNNMVVALTQTACQAALDDKVITNEEYLRSCTSQGHSPQTARLYYKVSDQCRSAYDVVMGDSPPSTSMVSPLSVSPVAPLSVSPVAPLSVTPLSVIPAGDPGVEVNAQTSATVASVVDKPFSDSSYMKLVAEAVAAVMKPRNIVEAGASGSRPSLKRKFTLEDGVMSIAARADQLQGLASELSVVGQEHPNFEKNSERVPASDNEKTWLFNYFNRNDDIFQTGKNNLFRCCLDAILVQNDARVLFHERHVHNSDRLKTCSLPVIKEVKQFRQDGMYPTWYKNTVHNVYAADEMEMM